MGTIVARLNRRGKVGRLDAHLRDLIDHGGPAAQSIVDGLGKLVVPRLRSRLDSEHLQLTGYFAHLVNAQSDPFGKEPEKVCSGSQASKFSALGFLLTQEYCRRLTVVTGRQKALEAYETNLAAAANALAELRSSSTKLEAAELARSLYDIGREIDDSLAALRKAFS